MKEATTQDLSDLAIGCCLTGSGSIHSPLAIGHLPTLASRMTLSPRRSSPETSPHGGAISDQGRCEVIDHVLSDEATCAGKLLKLPSLLDASDVQTPHPSPNDRPLTDWEDAATCAETCSDKSSTQSVEDDLAYEVGLSAHEYLEECFYTEVAVLDRAKFDAVPEVVKSDFIITGHLGKGSFSDVFEVVYKDKRSLETSKTTVKSNTGRRSTTAARAQRRASLSSSMVQYLTKNSPPRGGPQKLALKCLRPQIRSDIDQFSIGAEDLVHETAILANLNHRHIIKLHGRAAGHLTDAFKLNDGYFILLDRLKETLQDRIGRWKLSPTCVVKGPTAEQLEVAHSIADAMMYLHSKKIIFRDLKPANVGFDSQGVLKLFDLGFANGLPEPDKDNPSGLLYDRCGTPRYMAPEVGLSTGYGLPADVYSFGILLWEICSLSKPFASINSSEVFERAVFVEGARPAIETRWPTAVKHLMKRCWSGSPSKRHCIVAVKSTLSLAINETFGEKRRSARAMPTGLRRSSMH